MKRGRGFEIDGQGEDGESICKREKFQMKNNRHEVYQSECNGSGNLQTCHQPSSKPSFRI